MTGARFPAYGIGLWNRRYLGECIRVVALLVGNRWRTPAPFAKVPRVCVRTESWHHGPRVVAPYDWRLVAACTVVAVDVRGPDEREQSVDGWDAWLWLLADVQRYAREVLRFSPTEEFHDLPNAFAPERDLEVFAWNAGGRRGQWPAWWPYGDSINTQRNAA